MSLKNMIPVGSRLPGLRLCLALDGARMRLFNEDAGDLVGEVSLAPGVVDVKALSPLFASFAVEFEGVVFCFDPSRVAETRAFGFGETAAAQEFIPSPAAQAEAMVAMVTRRVSAQLEEKFNKRAARAAAAQRAAGEAAAAQADQQVRDAVQAAEAIEAASADAAQPSSDPAPSEPGA